MGNLIPGSVEYNVLLYSVSEPGEWRAEDIVADLPECDADQVARAVGSLEAAGFIHQNRTDCRLWPLRAGRSALQQLAV